MFFVDTGADFRPVIWSWADSKEDANGALHSERNGRFVSKGKNEGGGETAGKAETTETSETKDGAEKKDASTGQGFDAAQFEALKGKQFKGVYRKAAIRKLLKEKQGWVKGAFYRDEIGSIDLLWGDDNIGLQHIIKRRMETNPGLDIESFLEDIPDVIQYGTIHYNPDRKNYEIWYKKKFVVVGTVLHGHKVSFVVTAFPSRRMPSRFKKGGGAGTGESSKAAPDL